MEVRKNINENEEKLIDLVAYNKLKITNSFFELKKIYINLHEVEKGENPSLII